MKRILTIAMAVMLSCVTLSAQSESYRFGRPENEINLMYGRASVPGFAMLMGGVLATAFTAGLATMDEMWSSGAISLDYYRYVHPHVAVGAATTYEVLNLSFKTYSGKDEDGNAIYRRGNPAHTHFLSIMPAAKFPWFNYEKVGMYSKVAAGLLVEHTEGYTIDKEDGSKEVHEPSSGVNFACQLNPVCVEFGGLACRGFVELGWGMQGLVMVGVKYAF